MIHNHRNWDFSGKCPSCGGHAEWYTTNKTIDFETGEFVCSDCGAKSNPQIVTPDKAEELNAR